jgi:hypothetical protein
MNHGCPDSPETLDARLERLSRLAAEAMGEGVVRCGDCGKLTTFSCKTVMMQHEPDCVVSHVRELVAIARKLCDDYERSGGEPGAKLDWLYIVTKPWRANDDAD